MKKVTILLTSFMLITLMTISSTFAVLLYPIQNNGNNNGVFLKEYKTILKNNKISNDSKYNINHFYTKKILLNISIPQKLSDTLDSVYLIFGSQRYYNYIYAMKAQGSIDSTSSNIDKNKDYKNLIKYDLKKENIPTELVFSSDILKGHLNANDTTVKNLTITMYGKDIEGKEILLSNSTSISFNLDTLKSKEQYIKNKVYSSGNYTYVDSTKRVNDIFTRIQNSKTKSEYKVFLNDIKDVVKKVTISVKNRKEKLINSLNTEETLNSKDTIQLYNSYIQKETILFQISNKTKKELAKANEDIIFEDVFGPYLK